MNDSDMFCSRCGEPAVGGDPFAPRGETVMPMKWYKFLIYFSLWAGMVLSGLSVFSTTYYIISNLPAYLASPVLLVFDGASALLSASYFVLAYITRASLVKFEKKGPILLYCCYGLNAVISMVVEIGTYVVSGKFTEGYTGFTTLIVTVVIIIANCVYFRNRSHLFVN